MRGAARLDQTSVVTLPGAPRLCSKQGRCLPLHEASPLPTPSFPKSLGLTGARQSGRGAEAGPSRAIQAAGWQRTHQPGAELCRILSKNCVTLLLNSFSDPNGDAAWKAGDGRAHRRAAYSALKPNSVNFWHYRMFLMYLDASCLSASLFSGGPTIFSLAQISRLEDPTTVSLLQSFPPHRLESFTDITYCYRTDILAGDPKSNLINS